MNLFHNHVFLQSEIPEKLYCMCGKIIDLHKHKWIETHNILANSKNIVVGSKMKCETCGELKAFYI